MQLIRSMLNVMTIVFAVLLCFYYRKIIYAVLMAFDKPPQVYKTDIVHFCMTPEQGIFTLPPHLYSMKEEGSAKAIMTL